MTFPLETLFFQALSMLFGDPEKGCLNSIPFHFQVFGFVLDFMHTVGGGAATNAFEHVFGLDSNGQRAPRVGVETMVEVNMFMVAWSLNTPYELARNVSSFEKRITWKMREAHQALIYHSIPLMGMKGIREKVGESKATAFLALVYAMHLIGQTTHDCPSKKDIDTAAELLRHYVETMVQIEGEEFLTYKNHCLIHLANEARVYQTHLGGIDAYPYENFLSLFRRQLIKTGKGVLVQCYRALKELSFHFLPQNEEGEIDEYDVGNDAMAECMIRCKSMQLPSTTILEKCVNRRFKFIKCLGFKVTCSYPNNILAVKSVSGGDELGVLLVAVKDILFDNDILSIEAHAFDNVEKAHNDFWTTGSRMRRVIKYPLNKIGCYEAKFGLDINPVKIPFTQVLGKCFPFHMNLNLEPDPLKHLTPSAIDQWWTIIQFMHTLPPQTL